MRPLKLSVLACLAAGLFVAGCGKKEEASTPDAASVAAPAGAAAAAPGSWTPEALEELLAPVALYPDVVLGHVLSAATNPQEVLDAGNWLIEHQDLPGNRIDDEAQKLGLSVSTRALLQFPEVMDMMCMQMDWTTELGQAFTADQGAMLDAVQRLRAQAKDVGNLASSPQLKVGTESQDGKEIVTIDPPSPEVVYVPKYDPQAVYAPPPASIPPPSTINVSTAPGTTTTVTTAGNTTTVASAGTATTEEKGHSTSALVTTGLLAFGAGILVNEVFDDDDWDDYGPNYYHGGMYYGGAPYYPPPPYMYRPPYGGGYYPSHGYNRPANYQRGFNNNTIIVNDGGNDYWKRQSRRGDSVSTRPAQSPITAANPRRSDINDLNRQSRERSARPASQAATRDAARGGAPTGGYVGARPENRAARERMVSKSPPAGVVRDLPQRPQTEYKGATERAASLKRTEVASRQAATREPPQARSAGAADRGHGAAESRQPMDRSPAAPAARPAAGMPASQEQPAAQREPDRTAFGSGGGAQSGRAERQASARGRGSMGGGGGNKPRKPRKK
jgi:hypothetical protein